MCEDIVFQTFIYLWSGFKLMTFSGNYMIYTDIVVALVMIYQGHSMKLLLLFSLFFLIILTILFCVGIS